jgi:hypothetical protein
MDTPVQANNPSGSHSGLPDLSEPEREEEEMEEGRQQEGPKEH